MMGLAMMFDVQWAAIGVAIVIAGCGGSGHEAKSDAPVVFGDGSVDGGQPRYVVAKSGTRLKVSWYETPDGVRSPVPDVFFDSAMAVGCRPRKWTDGKTRCVP